MNLDYVAQLCGAKKATTREHMQTLWSGYGSILRVDLEKAPIPSVVVKVIASHSQETHPRGWNTSISHQRKVQSYRVEATWYDTYNASCHSKCRTPTCFGIHRGDVETWIVLEDLLLDGLHINPDRVNWSQCLACIRWLAYFHARFMQQNPIGLWPKGTYWHLATRPDELASLADPILKKYAHDLDRILSRCQWQTFVHGDAKLANFCFDTNNQVAAVDFQYVGGGCGMKDLAYFIGSCLDEEIIRKKEEEILDQYFAYLGEALAHTAFPEKEIETEWRRLFHVAWADFHRFLKGWSPNHWKLNSYSERVTRDVIRRIQEDYYDSAFP